MSETPRSFFAARLFQARQLRGLSQRGLGDRMGLGKEKGSTRINRYEQQASAVGFDSLDLLAKTLEVPAAYLLAETPEMADAILAIAQVDPAQQADVTLLLKALGSDPALLARLLALVSNTGKARPAKE
ncbi:helix-turn-helix domain-containing protein [Xanthomonas campestris pv. campestris]|uniref:helix-turn-helix domain-containing protein n=1 Tax=Xanthomonas campestris TaxID=339 RepID=UPI002B394B03|nr:helix-turn-helix domain-containing protein [Xanthomonas campestris pv. campestris]MEB1661072.1 helix-turn-helix domain-containing protein [Xanthomonas campestris pv. campestris]MEB1722992.1 helix-turn-helix domain-containing protein [Xanthomonas campestris pv. campestris]MEB1849372.1 helix-turn-helix domain-containing protein [Xanthomonas campestris pv. campestris]